MPYHAPELAELFQQMVQHQAAMVRAVETLARAVGVRPVDADQEPFLIAVGLAMGDRSFTAGELMTAGLGVSPAAALLAAHVAGNVSIKALGKRLAASAGKVTRDGALMLERQGDSADGAIWRVSNPQTQPVAPRGG